MDKKNVTLLLGVIYPGSEKYLSDYVESVEKQTCKSFDWLILNDGAALEASSRLPAEAGIVGVEKGKTPAEIRARGISFAIDNGYKYLIFSDTDDYFSENRVEASVEGLKEYDFVYNRLRTVTEGAEEGREISENYPPETTGYETILDRNILGLSNTAVAVENLKDIYIPRESIAVDWWIFTILLLRGRRGRYVEEAVTHYRQSDANIVGMGRLLTKERLKLGIEVKTLHYRNIYDYCGENGLPEEEAVFSRKLREMEELKGKAGDSGFQAKYIEVINKNFKEIFTGWWSEILPLQDWKKYE